VGTIDLYLYDVAIVADSQ